MSPTPLPIYSKTNIKMNQICVGNIDGTFSLKWAPKEGKLTAENNYNSKNNNSSSKGKGANSKKGFTKDNTCPDYMKSQSWKLPNHENYESAVFTVRGNSVCLASPCFCTLNTKETSEVSCDSCKLKCKDPAGTVEMMDLMITEVKAFPLPSLLTSGEDEQLSNGTSMSVTTRLFVLWMVIFLLILILLLLYFFLPRLFVSSHMISSLSFSRSTTATEKGGYHHAYEPIPELAE
jgi:hypothetical protein